MAFFKRLVLGTAFYLSSLGVVVAAEFHMIFPVMPTHLNEQGDGRIGDVIRASLQACGHQVSCTSVPLGRQWKNHIDNETCDGLATAEADQTFPGTSTLPFTDLQDGATVLTGSGLEDVVEDKGLYHKRVVAFPNGDKILKIEAVIPLFTNFKMRGNRFDQIRPLFAGRADADMADGLTHFITVLRDKTEASIRLTEATRALH